MQLEQVISGCEDIGSSWSQQRLTKSLQLLIGLGIFSQLMKLTKASKPAQSCAQHWLRFSHVCRLRCLYQEKMLILYYLHNILDFVISEKQTNRLTVTFIEGVCE